VARLEPIVVGGFVAHAVVTMFGLTAGWVRWPALIGLGALGTASLFGLVRPRGNLSLARALGAIGAAGAIGAMTGGIAASWWTLWLAVLAVVCSGSLEAGRATAVPPAVAVAYVTASTLGPDGLRLADGALGGIGLGAVGVVSLLIAHVVMDLRRHNRGVEDDLKGANSVIAAAFATSLGGMAILDVNGMVISTNQALQRFLGRNSPVVAGTEWSVLVHPAQAATMQASIDRLVRGEIDSVEMEARFPTVTGDIGHAIVAMSVIHDADGEPTRLFAHVSNISERVHSELRLRQSESHYKHLFELSPVPLWEVDMRAIIERSQIRDADGTTDLGLYLDRHSNDVNDLVGSTRVRNVNEAARGLLGASDEMEFAAGVVSGRLGSDHAVVFTDLVAGISGGILHGERPVIVKDFAGDEHIGTLRMLVPTVDGSPDLSGVVVAFIDTTEQAETEETLGRLEEQLRTVLSGAPIIVFSIDVDGVYTLSEGQALGRVGRSPGAVVGRSAFEVHRESPVVLRNIRRALAGETFTGVDEVGQLLFETRYSPVIERGEVTGVIGVSYDITDRVRTAERLRELVRSKDDFVATVSHELRTPLTAVVGFAHELRTQLGSLSVEDIETYVGLIQEQGTEVADLVEDLLVASRADQGEVPISLSATDLWQQVDAVVRARPLTKQLDTSARDSEAKVFADAIRVRQITRNLIINADRYGGRHIAVCVVDGDGVRTLEVSDDGVGVPEAHRPFIFEPYHRAHRDVGRTESVGLGLTVSRHLAELMGGSLSYTYTGGRSVFRLTLPAA
jgi:PAS domain S-box-containing protein